MSLDYENKFNLNDKIIYIGNVATVAKDWPSKDLIGYSGTVVEVFNLGYFPEIKIIYKIKLNDVKNTTAIVGEKEITFDHKISRLLYL